MCVCACVLLFCCCYCLGWEVVGFVTEVLGFFLFWGFFGSDFGGFSIFFFFFLNCIYFIILLLLFFGGMWGFFLFSRLPLLAGGLA